mgnify:FL=1
MFRPYIKRTYILVLVAMINLLLVYLSYQSYSFTKSQDYELKIRAATIMKNALDLTKGLDNPKVIDRFKSGLVGVDSTDSQMTTKKGFLESKVATTNPNFAAVFIDWFSTIGISSDISNVPDTVAVSMTGSFPGANIAFLSACKASNVYPVIISSIGSSSWGANQIDKTWIEIENTLIDANFFNYKSKAFSLGGDNDQLDELPDDIKKILENKIIKNNYDIISGDQMQDAVNKRIKKYKEQSSNYKAYVNIGGSSASLGDSTTSKMYLPGLIFGKDEAIADALDDEYYDEYEYQQEVIPVVEYFLSEQKIPVINVRNINNLCEWYGLPYSNLSFNDDNVEVGAGELFGIKTKHRFSVVWLSTLASLALIAWLAISSIIQVNNKMKEIDNDSII